jgi:hypothetical protein
LRFLLNTAGAHIASSMSKPAKVEAGKVETGKVEAEPAGV